jgi:5,10-methylenetetrahydromethanopterin reductase
MAGISFSRGIATTTDEWIHFCQAAERLGFAQVWGSDTIGNDSLIDAALALQTTELIRVGTSIAYPIRSPLQTATAAAALANFKPGRFTLGIGFGGEANLVNNGIGSDRPLRRTGEFLQAIQTVLRSPKGTPAEFSGNYFTARGPAYGLSPAELPVVIGGYAEGMTKLAARHADGMVFHFSTSPKLVEKRLALANSLRPEDALPFISVAAHYVAVHPDEGVALRRARAHLTILLRGFPLALAELSGEEIARRYYDLIDAGRLGEAAELLPEETVREFVLVTTPDRMRDDLVEVTAADQVLTGLLLIRDPRLREAFGFTEANDVEAREAFTSALFA